MEAFIYERRCLVLLLIKRLGREPELQEYAAATGNHERERR